MRSPEEGVGDEAHDGRLLPAEEGDAEERGLELADAIGSIEVVRASILGLGREPKLSTRVSCGRSDLSHGGSLLNPVPTHYAHRGCVGKG
jgi:hypothetical protein